MNEETEEIPQTASEPCAVQQPEPEPEPAPDPEREPAPDPEPDTEALIAEAEQRGYMRGLNEAASRAMEAPVLFEDLARRRAAATDEPQPSGGNLCDTFLTGLRPSVWD